MSSDGEIAKLRRHVKGSFRPAILISGLLDFNLEKTRKLLREIWIDGRGSATRLAGL